MHNQGTIRELTIDEIAAVSGGAGSSDPLGGILSGVLGELTGVISQVTGTLTGVLGAVESELGSILGSLTKELGGLGLGNLGGL